MVYEIEEGKKRLGKFLARKPMMRPTQGISGLMVSNIERGFYRKPVKRRRKTRRYYRRYYKRKR